MSGVVQNLTTNRIFEDGSMFGEQDIIARRLR